jgi:hypothetical protein
MKKYSVHIIWAVVAVVVFAGGYFYGKSTAPSLGGNGGTGFNSSTRGAAFAGRGGGAGGGFTAGTITAMDSSSITLQLPNGNSEVVFYSNSTTVSKPTDVPISTLAVGSNVMVGGSANSDGSLTASTIQVRVGSSTPGFGGRGG